MEPAACLDRVDTPQDIWDRAAEIQEAMTEQAQHRPASIPDLIVAAAARASGLEILHYDHDFDTIARYTGQPARWIAPPGTVLPAASSAAEVGSGLRACGFTRAFRRYTGGTPLASRRPLRP